MNPLVRWIDSQYTRRCHVVVTTPDGREGFALFGGFRARHRFGALYLPEAPRPLRTRVMIHQSTTSDHCRRLLARFGLVVFCGESAPRDLASDLLPVPVMLDMEMPTPGIPDGAGARWGKSAKSNISQIRRGRFSFDVVNDAATVATFYRTMYLPSMRARHDREAYVERKRTLLRIVREGAELLRVFQDGEWVAATLNLVTPAGYRLLRLGWRRGNEQLRRSGVVSATYWFSFERAASLGCRRVLLGSVLPHLEDGVLLYKSHWGATFSDDHRDFGTFRLLLDPSHPVCGRFLRATSTIVKSPRGDLVVFSGRAPEETAVAPALLQGISRWYLWRDQPTVVPEPGKDDVPRGLRPWVTSWDLNPPPERNL